MWTFCSSFEAVHPLPPLTDLRWGGIFTPWTEFDWGGTDGGGLNSGGGGFFGDASGSRGSLSISDNPGSGHVEGHSRTKPSVHYRYRHIRVAERPAPLNTQEENVISVPLPNFLAAELSTQTLKYRRIFLVYYVAMFVLRMKIKIQAIIRIHKK